KKEQEICIRAHLNRQIEVVSPAIICLLGGVAAKALLGRERVSEIRGEASRRGKEVFFPTCHPAAAGRSRSWYRALSQDMKNLHTLMRSE
ncbi:MAG: hypothetical protein KAJ09_14495, partial [Deltaproteobacteria bacterium]|nr:hypothetical protein [Deltaproteobacteria bacterium]